MNLYFKRGVKYTLPYEPINAGPRQCDRRPAEGYTPVAVGRRVVGEGHDVVPVLGRQGPEHPHGIRAEVEVRHALGADVCGLMSGERRAETGRE